MVAYYEIFGQKVGSHILSMGVLGSLFAGGWMMSGGKKQQPSQSPPINASSKDEENFIQEFLKNADAGGQGEAKH